MLKLKFLLVIGILAFTSLACGFSIGGEEPTEDIGPELTITAQALQLEELASQMTTEAQQTEEVTEAPTEEIVVVEPSPTEEVAEETETPEVESEFSQLEQVMRDEIQFLNDEGVLSTTEGEFIPFEDWEQEVAKINYVNWYATDYAPKSFVIRANTEWNSASDIANWDRSGCGFVFGEEDENNFHLAYLGLDGIVRLQRWVKGTQEFLAEEQYGDVDIPDGSAEVMLVVNGKNVTYYVNGEKVLSSPDNLLEPGTLSFTVLSGTNKDFGTRCKLTDVGLFIIE